MSKKKKANDIALKDEAKKRAELIAELQLHPTWLSALSIKELYGKCDEITVSALSAELSAQARSIHSGDLKRAESMLMAQAHTLDVLFATLIKRSETNMSQHLNAAEKYMRLALKAQSQCRMTLGTLAEIKNPKPYIRQQNMAYNQQVNNGVATSSPEKNLKTTNELLEDKRHEQQWMDARAPEETIRDDKIMEAVEAEYRTED